MAKALLRSPWQGVPLARVAAALAVGAFFLGTALTAAAQSASKAEEGAGFGPIEEPTKNINKRLNEKWEENKIKAADRCDDYTFIRRATLDVIGRIPKVPEIELYMKDPQSVRRGMLVDRLLKSPEYQQNWATIWTWWLMTRTGDRLYRDQIHLWLEELFEQDSVSIKDMAEKLITATGKTNDNGAVNYILANLGGSTTPGGRRGMNADNPAVLKKSGQFDMVPVTSRTVRLFLGYQIQCTQCHDHPFNAEWKQKNFWGVNAFFRQTERVGAPAMMRKKGMPSSIMTLKDNTVFNEKGIIFFEKRNGVFLPSEAVFLDGTRLPKGTKVSSEGMSRRQELSKYLTGHKNFTRAYVNRMWAHLFSRGMNSKPVADDFGEHNEVVHEELLTELGDAFKEGNYDPKKLIKWVTASEAYNLKVTANKSNDQPEAEPYVSRMMLKAMAPEQLLESLLIATQPAVAKDDEANRKFKEDWMRRLTVNFGDDEGNELTYNGTIVQALLMMNGRDINAALGANSGTVQAAMKKKSYGPMLDYLFLATLSRPATRKEHAQIGQKLMLRGAKDTEKSAPLQDVFWALLNCNEFILNH
jgi:hypothetical protein